MTTQPTVHPATPAATSIPQGMRPEIGCRAGTRTTHTAARLRRRALIAALGLAVAAAVLPAGAASASPQAPEVDTHFTNLGGNPQPPEPPEPPDPPAWGPQDVANPTENPEPPLPPDPPDVPDWGPDDLANPTENPEPPLPPEDPDPAGDGSIPTPERVDAGFGGTAGGPHQAAGLALIAAAVMLALLFAVTVRRDRSGASR
jgi:hypothetical protein